MLIISKVFVKSFKNKVREGFNLFFDPCFRILLKNVQGKLNYSTSLAANDVIHGLLRLGSFRSPIFLEDKVLLGNVVFILSNFIF